MGGIGCQTYSITADDTKTKTVKDKNIYMMYIYVLKKAMLHLCADCTLIEIL